MLRYVLERKYPLCFSFSTRTTMFKEFYKNNLFLFVFNLHVFHNFYLKILSISQNKYLDIIFSEKLF